jgi:hypothetical protein
MPIESLAGGEAAGFSSETAEVLIGFTLELCDRATDTLLADLTEEASSFTLKLRRTGQPTYVGFTISARSALIKDTSFDGERNLMKGIRTVKVRLDGQLIAHAIVWKPHYTGEENTVTVDVDAYDPLQTAKGRPYRDSTGNLVDPDIATPASAATILKAGFENTISNSGPPGDQEGALPLDVASGTFDTTIPPAVDVSVELQDWPVQLDEVTTLLADTGTQDVWVEPTETALGTDPGIVGILNVANRRGSDLSGTVHFDYVTGDNNIAKCDRSDSMDEVQNKLVYYLGPKKDVEHWQGNITATETTPYDLSAYLTLEEASRARYWTIMRIRTIDDDGASTLRAGWHEVWKEEVRSSVDGQEIIKVTPTVDCAFQPFRDYMPGDTVGLNIGDDCGPELTGGTQRLDGFEVTVNDDGAAIVGELLTLQEGS